MNNVYRRGNQAIVMLGVDPASKRKGGIAAVVDTYRASGLFSRWRIHFIGTVASGSHARKVRYFIKALWTYCRLVFARRVCLVHAHTASRASFWRKSAFMLIARSANIPVILHLHGGDFESFYRSECGRIGQCYVRYVLRCVDRVVVLSSQWRTRIERIEPAAQVTTIANPVPLPIATSISERHDSDVLFLGRLCQPKGIFDLLEACAIAKAKYPALQLRCGGDGDVEAVVARAHELGLQDRLHLLGWVSGAAKERELAQATIHVLPSYAEGLPMGVLEAMAAGAPTIATSVGGIPDAIQDGVSGFLIEPGDVKTLADRILRLFADAELRARFAAAARGKVETTFSSQRVIAQLEELYKRLGVLPRPLRITTPHSSTNARERLDLSVGDR